MGLFRRTRPIGSALYAAELYEDAIRSVDEQTRMAAERDTRDRLKEARLEWLEANHAERSFPCGVVPQPAPAPGEPTPELNVPRNAGMWMQVFAAVLPSDLVFFHGQAPGVIVEVGRLPRNAIRDVDVVDQAESHIPAPSREDFEPPRPVFAVLRWMNEGVPDEDRFAFRSPWMAWQAAHQLIAAKLSDGARLGSREAGT